MCKSMAEGGQRCAAHTRPKVLKAASAIEAAATSGDVAALRAAQTQWEEAATEYASTTEGHQHLSAQAASALASGDYDTHALLNTVVQRGEAMRAANRETGALIKAARMSGAEPSETTPAAPAAPALPAVPEEPETLVPDLSPAQRQEWARLLGTFEEMAPEIKYFSSPRGTIYPPDMIKALPKMDATLGDPEASDKDLTQALHLAAHYGGVRYSMPTWRQSDADHAVSLDEQDALRLARVQRWQAFAEPFAATVQAQVDRALAHPNAGLDTYEKYEECGYGTSDDLTARSDVPLPYLMDRIRTRVPARIHQHGWDKARAARFEADGGNGVALVLAVKDPDSFHRNEALNQVMVAPLDTFTAKERHWLASNLHALPGSEENQRILASSLKAWALGYADAEERRRLGATLLTSRVAAVAEIGAELSGKPPATVGGGKKGWFR